MEQHTKEPQYNHCLDVATDHLATLGLMSNQVWHEDPKRLAFVLARYKFAAKMFAGLNRVLEVGCADAFGSRIVLQEVESLTACDFDPVFVADANRRMDAAWKFECVVHDMLSGPMPGGFDAAYSIDVLEHIPPADEDRFVSNIVQSLNPAGVCLFGSPSIESQTYASPQSKAGHVNCKNAPQMKALLGKYFHNVFLFSMNDEVVHTGFYPLAHYLFALCCHRK
ncbi:MAG TPA: class I SAM-dependent methyltransferase [Verrucomicrobiae bacterium]|jgi:SAM-dependent methyltransferase|nr:class I SAM-dependent methyltransferase [Verrucomicrobiae bacterium]